jgi:Protein of unknown function (DUF3987)
MTSGNFDIRQQVEYDASGRAPCPACLADGKLNQKNLSIDLATGAYHCWRGCTPEQIRAVLGQPKSCSTPIEHRQTSRPKVNKDRTISQIEVLRSQQRLLNHHDQPQQHARQWLAQRGFSPEMIRHYHLGLESWSVQGQPYWSISIPIPANQEDRFYRKVRIAPWQPDRPSDLPKWSQLGISTTIFTTYAPDDAEETWFCEGEWDAMRLGWLARSLTAKVAVCCSTSGCSAVPPQAQLNELPGDVVIFFDRNDTPTKDGMIPGEAGAVKLAQALQGRGKIAQVPMPTDCQVRGWDVSNALDAGFGWADFVQAAQTAIAVDNRESPSAPHTPMQSVGEVLRQIVEHSESPFQRDAALLDFAQQTPYTFRDLGTLAKSVEAEVEWEARQQAASQKLRALLQHRPAPLDLNRFLEPWFAKILLDTAHAMPTAPEFLFTTLLSAAASRVGTAAQIVIKPSAKYTQPMVFWTAIVAQSGSLKTPAQRIILDPLIALEKDANDIYQAELEAYERAKAAGTNTQKPTRKRYLTKDSTLETLQRIHAENSRGILYYRDELAGAFKSRNQYRGGQGADEEAELDQWTGSALIVDRAERSTCLPKTSICRTGNYQWEVLSELMGDHRDVNGAWSRWLFCAADAPLRYLNLHADEPETTISETLTWLYLRLEELPKRDYLLSLEAKYLFEAWQHQLVDTQQLEEVAGLQLVYPKIEAYTARLALWLHIVNAVLRREQPTALISGDTMEQAIELAAYFLWQHRLIHTHNSPESGLAAIALKIQQFAKRVGTVSASRLKSGIRALRQTTTDQIRQLMQTLAEQGYGFVRGDGADLVYAAASQRQPSTVNSVDATVSTSSIPVNSATPAIADSIDKIDTSTESDTTASAPPDSFQPGEQLEVLQDDQWVPATYHSTCNHVEHGEHRPGADREHYVYLLGDSIPRLVPDSALRGVVDAPYPQRRGHED